MANRKGPNLEVVSSNEDVNTLITRERNELFAENGILACDHDGIFLLPDLADEFLHDFADVFFPDLSEEEIAEIAHEGAWIYPL